MDEVKPNDHWAKRCPIPSPLNPNSKKPIKIRLYEIDFCLASSISEQAIIISLADGTDGLYGTV
jgi:hypothetical protein